MEDPVWISHRKGQSRGRSVWRRIKHALSYNQWLHKLHNSKKPKLLLNHSDESHKLLDDDKQNKRNESESEKEKSRKNILISERETRFFRRNESYPQHGGRRRGYISNYKPIRFKDKENEIWISAEKLRDITRERGEKRKQSSIDSSSVAEIYSRLFGSGSEDQKDFAELFKSLSMRKEQEIPSLPLRRIRSLSSAESFNLHHHNLYGDKPADSEGSSRTEIVASAGDKENNAYEKLLVLDISNSCREEEIIDLFSLDENSISSEAFVQEEPESASPETEVSEAPTGSDDKCEEVKDLSCMMDLPQSSGFNTVNYFNGKLYLREQRLNRSMFKEIEAFWTSETQGKCDHRMMFDLVNEILVQICDRSFSYYPKMLSCLCRVRSFPPENVLVEDVCGSIGSLLRLKPEVKKSKDRIVGRDLEKDDVWMNLQLDSEDVALELEDMTFCDVLDELLYDDLLSEFICSLVQ